MFKRGDLVHIVDEPRNIGVVMEIVDPDCPRCDSAPANTREFTGRTIS
jgi:hypothetical protein